MDKIVDSKIINGIMARKCYVNTCSNTYEKTKNICVIDEKSCTLAVISYHQFPKDHYLRRKWIEATGRTNWKPTKTSFICSEHFKESDYATVNQNNPENDDVLTEMKRTLKRNAVPTQLLGSVSKLEGPNDFSQGNSVNDLELSEISGDRIDQGVNEETDTGLLKIKEEPDSREEFCEEPPNPPFIITSAVTVKEENDHGGSKCNGILESQVSPTSYSSSNYIDSRCCLDHLRPKRLKHQDSLIAAEDIKIERCSPTLGLNSNLTIEEKYERLLDEYLKLKRDFDLQKFQFDFQREVIKKCKQMLSECR